MHRSLIIAAAAFATTTCASSRFDPTVEQSRLLRRDAEWAEAAAHRDLEKTLSYWTDDATVIPPAQPALEGKPAIRGFVAASFQIPGFNIRWKSEKVTFSPDGRMAYMRGTNEMTVPGPTGAAITLHGRGITVWRLDADGSWRCAVDIWNAPSEDPGVGK